MLKRYTNTFIIMRFLQSNCLMVLLTITLISISCSPGQTEIVHNGKYQEVQQIAMDRNENFCIVLIDTTNLTSKLYISRLENCNFSAVFNMVDIKLPQNNLYNQWLYSNSDPVTCIFGPSGKLIDIIPGASRKCFNCIEQVIKSGSMCTDIAYYNNFSINKEKIIPLLNDILQCKLDFERGQDIESRINNLSDSIDYPYTAYLRMMNLAEHNKLEAAQLVAERLLKFNNDLELEIYPEFFTVAKGIIDPNYNAMIEPVLKCETKIELNDCKIGVAKPFRIKIFNSGSTPLLIHDIQLSCSCVELEGSEKHTILPEKSEYINFQFTADKDKKVEREIIIKSNAINPIQRVRVIADNS